LNENILISLKNGSAIVILLLTLPREDPEQRCEKSRAFFGRLIDDD